MSRMPLMLMISAGLILFLSLGTRQSFGLYLVPMSQDLGWGREVFSLAIAIQNLVWGLSQPFVGMIADKYGTARTGVVGSILFAIGLYLMATPDSPLDLYIGSGALLGFALSAVTFATVLGAVGRAVPPEKRGAALGIVSAGGSAGQFIMVLINQELLLDYGWSLPLMIATCFGLFMAGLFYPLRGRASESVERPQSLGAALGEAFRHRGFLYLTAGFFVCGFQITFILTHLPAYVADSAMPGWLGGTALALIGFFNIVGTYGSGVLGDRYRKKYVLSAMYLARAAVIAVFLVVPISPYSVIVFAAAMGLMWLGTVPLTSGLVAQIFGVRYMTTLFGIVFFSHQIGSFLGVWLGGLLYDLAGSYAEVWYVAIVLGVLAAVLHWPIADRPVARLTQPAPAAG
ncbi:MAG TPA: MFS transporter [Alphaproteobacteria bacterium]